MSSQVLGSQKQRVVVLGASDQSDRYAFRAIKLLLQHGHEVVPVNPRLEVVEGLSVVASLDLVTGPVDTLTLYVAPRISGAMIEQIVQLQPGRVIFNPGTENAELQAALHKAGIAYEMACTLVLLNTGQF